MVHQVRKAFTLIEILIVVIILGILAAIVVPQFTSATEDAQISNVQTQLQTVRNQIELYRIRNNGVYPDFIGVLGGTFGNPAAVLPVDQGLRGDDYLKTDPVNPRTAGLGAASDFGKLIIAGAGPGPLDNAGWIWDVATNTFHAARFDEHGIISGEEGTPQWLGN